MTDERENRLGIDRRIKQSYDDLETAYEVGLSDLDAGVPLQTVIRTLRREYKQVYRAVCLREYLKC